MEENNNWKELAATERENYLNFHSEIFEEDLKHAEKNLLEFPRWSIISGYYCMHDITKLFLAEKFNIKISSPEIHKKTIEALAYFVNDSSLKKNLLKLLNEAKEVFYSAERLKEKLLPTLLRKGKQERGKSQYYTEDYNQKEKISSRKASYFIETIVKPYLKIIKELIK